MRNFTRVRYFFFVLNNFAREYWNHRSPRDFETLYASRNVVCVGCKYCRPVLLIRTQTNIMVFMKITINLTMTNACKLQQQRYATTPQLSVSFPAETCSGCACHVSLLRTRSSATVTRAKLNIEEGEVRRQDHSSIITWKNKTRRPRAEINFRFIEGSLLQLLLLPTFFLLSGISFDDLRFANEIVHMCIKVCDYFYRAQKRRFAYSLVSRG